jgi:hypothetical protein
MTLFTFASAPTLIYYYSRLRGHPQKDGKMVE